MKKYLLSLLGLGLFAGAVFAINVNSIPDKSPGAQVTYTEFNSLINVLKGIFNTEQSGTGRHFIGINQNTVDNITLSVKGLIMVKPVSSSSKPTCDTSTEGAIFADSDGDKHLWGCNGKEWVKLDSTPPSCN